MLNMRSLFCILNDQESLKKENRESKMCGNKWIIK